MTWHRLETCIEESWPFEIWRDRKILLAVSGGPDSIALLRAMLRIAGNPKSITVGHYNHRWRGLASDGDADFVRSLCNELGVVLIEGSANPDADTLKSEESARRCRYDFLTKSAYSVGARFVLTGHTADDRIETVLHNLLRGSGLAGIAGPRVVRQLGDGIQLVRPLLNAFRSDVLDYLDVHAQNYRTDESNRDERFSRNFIRARLLPLVREHYIHGVDQQILSLSKIALESIDALSELGRKWLDQQLSDTKEPFDQLKRTGLERPWYVAHCRLQGTPEPVIREALKHLWQLRQWPLKPMSRYHWKQTFAALIAQHGPVGQCQNRLTLPGSLRVVAVDDWRFIGSAHLPSKPLKVS